MLRRSRSHRSHVSRQVDLHFHFAIRCCNPLTRAIAKLLGPCFKTGRMGRRPLHRDARSRDALTPPPKQRRPSQMPPKGEMFHCALSELSALSTSRRSKIILRLLESTPSASVSAVSRSLELSLQSSLQLSLTVLVRYRNRVNI